MPTTLSSMQPHMRSMPAVSASLGGTVDFEQVMELDMQYIREWSPLLDAKILLLTLPAVIRGNGAV